MKLSENCRELIVAYLKTTTKDVALFSHVLHHLLSIPSEVHFSVNCADQYALSERVHLILEYKYHMIHIDVHFVVSAQSLQGV